MLSSSFIPRFTWPALFLLLSCDEGLKPPSESGNTLPSAFSGLILFSNWDAVDTLYDLRIVAFLSYPPGDIVTEVLQGRAVVYPPLQDENPLAARGTDSLRYTALAPANTYPYVVVAHRFGEDLFMDWRPVGQYDLDTTSINPSPVII